MRAWLQVLAGALLVAFTGGLSAQNPAATPGQPPPTPLAAPARDSLTAPAILQNRSDEPNTVEVTLTAAPTRLALVPGIETDVFAYNAQIPGPTLEVREGDRVIVHFRNRLPEETTVHWHGLHIAWAADGSPFHPVAPGGQADFVFTIQRGTAGTYWYHPHPHHHTRKQVAKGLYGAIIVRAADDPLQALPEKLLILSDNRFLADGSVDVPDTHSPQGRVDFENGREGDVRFVNGQIMPTIALRSGEVQRWRVINASAARVYRLRLPGHELLHVGSDGGLFERPVATSEVLIANSERVELLVRGTGRRAQPDRAAGSALQPLRPADAPGRLAESARSAHRAVRGRARDCRQGTARNPASRRAPGYGGRPDDAGHRAHAGHDQPKNDGHEPRRRDDIARRD